MSSESTSGAEEEFAAPPEVVVDPEMAREFMEITGCNQNLTESILRNHPSLEAAIEYFYGTPADAPDYDPEEAARQLQKEMENEGVSQEEIEEAEELNYMSADDLQGLEVSLTSWNIDGLDNANRSSRFQACYYVIKRINPDFVFLQEVVKSTSQYLTKLEQLYNIYFSDLNAQYFTAILVGKQLEVVNHQVIHFTNSGMGRTLQILEGRIGPVKVFLLNTHLESMAEHSDKRRQQFRLCMSKIQEIISKNPGCLLYFGGDLNARDKEIQEDASCIPRGVADAWMAAGCDIKKKYTFDMTQNDNKTLGQARCRFDRIYFYGPLNISSFELEGKQRIRSSLCFPSDHWAVSCVFRA